MKFTLNWLKEHLDTDASLDRITDTLTAIGLEVEEVTDRSAAFAPFIIAEIVEAQPHPDADRLKLCQVNTGKETLQIVCGAPNARTGLKGVLAPIGATMPVDDFRIKKSKIRGVESHGMLCSERELGLGAGHEGIIELDEDAPVGEPFAPYLGVDDPVIEIAITPNRGDCLGVCGIARDLAAAGLGTVKPLTFETTIGDFKSPVDVSITDPHCPWFVGRYFKGVKNGPSPRDIQYKLRAIGLRPISALVDITNYISYTYGRPLHVFDADKLKGNLHVRPSKQGETLEALDENTYTLACGYTVIADDSGPQALGGIMGGEETGCTEETVNVFLEVALFDPVQIARTGRELNINSDARYRFERSVDPDFVMEGAEIASEMIQELCGGTASEYVIAGSMPAWERSIAFRPERVQELIGIDVPEEESIRILGSLGFEAKKDGAAYSVHIPSWRPDIEGEADLVEEVARIHGYDAIPALPLPPAKEHAADVLPLVDRRQQTARHTLAARGLTEIYSWSFLDAEKAALFDGGNATLTLLNPISSDLDTMRPSLLPNLIDAARRNADRSVENLALFEVGAQFESPKPDGQRQVAAGIRTGKSETTNVHTPARAADAFDAKADALAVLEACGAPVDKLQITDDAPGWYHPARSGTLTLGKHIVLGYFGELHPRTLKALDVKGPVAAFEVFIDRIPEPKARAGKARPPLQVSDYQPVERDFAFVVAEEVPAADIVRAIRKAEKNLLQDIQVFDVYQGAGLEDGQKSIAVNVTLQAPDRTLTDEEIETLSRRMIVSVQEATGASLRGGNQNAA